MAPPLLKEKQPRLTWPRVANHKSPTVGLTHGATGYKGTRQEHGCRPLNRKPTLTTKLQRHRRTWARRGRASASCVPRWGPLAHLPRLIDKPPCHSTANVHTSTQAHKPSAKQCTALRAHLTHTIKAWSRGTHAECTVRRDACMPRHIGQTAQPKTHDTEQSTNHVIQCSATPQREVDNVYMLYTW